jgi:alcohol dehydrogenase class IV
MHTPLAVTDEAMAVVAAQAIDGTIAIGGGSAIGLGKAIAFRTDCPQIAVPTTYAGSEMTNILGETSGGTKTTRRDARIQPETVIYDPDLTRSLPPALAATSGLNAIAHALEALYARDGNPLISLMAEEGIRALASALQAGAAGRDDALYGAWLCGSVLGMAAMALHHKLCHVLGGSFDLPHGETHAVILPHAAAYNAPAVPEAIGRVARALGSATAPRGLYDLAVRLGAPMSLAELGFRRDDLEKAADLALASPYWNPREVTRDGVLKLLQSAFTGTPPEE